jgi:hypothetical protein
VAFTTLIMKTQGATLTRNLPTGQARFAGTAPRGARLPFLDPWPEPSGNDLLLLNPRPDLTPLPEPTGRRGAFFEIILA